MDWREQLAEIKTKLKPIEPASAKRSRSQTAGVSATMNTTTASKKTANGKKSTNNPQKGNSSADKSCRSNQAAKQQVKSPKANKSSNAGKKTQQRTKQDAKNRPAKTKKSEPGLHLIMSLPKFKNASAESSIKLSDSKKETPIVNFNDLLVNDFKQTEFITRLLSEPAQTIKFSGPSEEGLRSKKQIVIGLDFGTAFTKVVVGDITYAYAVPFVNGQYLLPSQLHVDKNGGCSFSKLNSMENISNLKLPIILAKASEAQLCAAATYLALVLSHCRSWVEKSTPFSGHSINWLLNVGLPAESYDDKKLTGLYQKLMQVAWALSYSKDINLNVAKQLWLGDILAIVPKHAYLPNSHLGLFPEFIAQIVGYVQSPSRRKYSHLLVDIGAGTLDVVFFTVHYENGDWIFYTYGQQVKPLGVEMLYRHRLNAIGSNLKLDNSAFPSNNEFMQRFSLSQKELNIIDKPFVNAVASCIFDTLRDSDQNYMGGAVGKFSEKITTFLCGGGAAIGNYSMVFNFTPSRYPLDRYRLPKPSRLVTKDVGRDLYHRLSVAYGLSYDSFNIGQVVKQRRDNPGDNVKSQSFDPSDYVLSGGSI